MGAQTKSQPGPPIFQFLYIELILSNSKNSNWDTFPPKVSVEPWIYWYWFDNGFLKFLEKCVANKASMNVNDLFVFLIESLWMLVDVIVPQTHQMKYPNYPACMAKNLSFCTRCGVSLAVWLRFECEWWLNLEEVSRLELFFGPLTWWVGWRLDSYSIISSCFISIINLPHYIIIQS